ncbi:helix-turn-helix domain-containing protein [Streptomyces sp. NPDC093516]|uniref:helix-turn-helix domain-containing protein n=1 Tax=Streptomyces sp. NPDC093516 TaxID=3155304 RepID=UPI00343D3A3D
MLEAAGVSQEQDFVYCLLVTAGGSTALETSRRAGMTEDECTRVLESLVRQGMASHTDGTPRVFRAFPPDVALLPRIKNTAEARQIQINTRDEMLWFCRAQSVAMPSGTNTGEFDALGRGVRYRVLCEKPFFDDEGANNNVVAGVRAGEIARAVPSLPLRGDR